MKSNEQNQNEIILKLLSEKSVMKQDVFNNTIEAFNRIKDTIKTRAENLSNEIF